MPGASLPSLGRRSLLALVILASGCSTTYAPTDPVALTLNAIEIRDVPFDRDESELEVGFLLRNNTDRPLCLSSQLLGLDRPAGADFLELKDAFSRLIPRDTPGYPTPGQESGLAQYDLRVEAHSELARTYTTSSYAFRSRADISTIQMFILGYDCADVRKYPIDLADVRYREQRGGEAYGILSVSKRYRLSPSICTDNGDRRQCTFR